MLGAHFVHMSGHSHAKTVMATKMANAAKKGKIFSKFGRLITIAVKDVGGSGDPSTNSKLKATIEQAKKMGLLVNAKMPEEIYALMDLYPQAGQRRPSVEFIPTPYLPSVPSPHKGRGKEKA